MDEAGSLETADYGDRGCHNRSENTHVIFDSMSYDTTRKLLFETNADLRTLTLGEIDVLLTIESVDDDNKNDGGDGLQYD